MNDETRCDIGTIGTLYVGSDKYAFTVVEIKSRFKSGKCKDHPSRIVIRLTRGSLEHLRFSSITKKWRSTREKGPKYVQFYRFGVAIDELDRGF
jgi:hypothetical protein